MSDLEEQLRSLIKLKRGSCELICRENSRLEFKETFNLGSISKYARTMASFANNEGGFLVFGVKDNPRQIIGVNDQNFSSVDPAKITSFLNSNFSPEIEWEIGNIEIANQTLGFMYTFPAHEKPIVATATNGKEIKESVVYYRYRAQTSAIKYPELRTLIESRIDRERKAWVQHLEMISKVGPTRVGILDTVEGKIFGAGAPFLIDETLLRQLKFVREGNFSESKGAPALRLIGEVKSISGVKTDKIVKTGIHYDDLITAFLANRDLSVDDAKSYLRECAYQTSPSTLLFFYVTKSGLTREGAIEFLKEQRNAQKLTLKRLLNRLKSENPPATPKIDRTIKGLHNPTAEEMLKEINAQKTVTAHRSLIFFHLCNNPALIRENILEIDALRYSEAVVNLSKSELMEIRSDICEALLQIFNIKFQYLKDTTRTFFRNAIKHLDQLIYS